MISVHAGISVQSNLIAIASAYLPCKHCCFKNMSKVMPKELQPNRGRGLFLIGTVHSKQMKRIADKDVHEMHLVCGGGAMDILYIEAWRVQGNKLSTVSNGDVVKIENLSIKPLGDKTRFQASSNPNYGNIAQTTVVTLLTGDSVPQGMPIKDMPTTRLSAVQTLKQTAYQISTVAIVADVTPVTSANGPKFHVQLVDTVKVRMSVWEDAKSIVEQLKTGDVVLLTRLCAQDGKDNSTELQSSRYTSVQRANAVLEKEIKDRNKDLNAAQSLSYDYTTRVDYSSCQADSILLANLQNLLVPGVPRDIPIIFEAHYCMVRSFEPLGNSDLVYYEGCPECKKSMAGECTVHRLMPIKFFLGMFSIADHYGTISAKAIGSVCFDILGITADACVPDKDGETLALADAIDRVMNKPMVLRFNVTKYEEKQRNNIELVHARPAIDFNTGIAIFPDKPLRLTAPGVVAGIPPVLISSLSMKDDTFFVRDKTPVTSIQIWVQICGEGTEDGCLVQEGDLVRLTRSAKCITDGTECKIRRTGTLNNMMRFMKFSHSDYLYAVVIPQEKKNGMWHLSLVACETWSSADKAAMFNTYWIKQLDLFNETIGMKAIDLDKAWTPHKRTRQIREEEGINDTTPSPQRLTLTVPKFGEGATSFGGT